MDGVQIEDLGAPFWVLMAAFVAWELGAWLVGLTRDVRARAWAAAATPPRRNR